MTKLLLASTLLLGAQLAGLAQADKALLYEVTGNKLAAPSYLYGTFHLVCPNDLVINEPLKKAVNATKQLYLELDMDDPTLQVTMLQQLMFTDGKTVKDYLLPDDYSLLDTYLTKHAGMGMAQLNSLKPIALYSFMAVGALGCQPASYDLALMQLAQANKKEILGLEHIEEQLAAFNKIPLEKQVAMLVDMARKPDEARQELATLLKAYKAQDLPALMNQLKDSQFSGPDGFEADLLDERNRNWLPIIEEAAQTTPTFFAFGAGHLGGSSGVVALLRGRGYTVKAIK